MQDPVQWLIEQTAVECWTREEILGKDDAPRELKAACYFGVAMTRARVRQVDVIQPAN